MKNTGSDYDHKVFCIWERNSGFWPLDCYEANIFFEDLPLKERPRQCPYCYAPVVIKKTKKARAHG